MVLRLLVIFVLWSQVAGESRHTCFTPGETKSTNIGCPADSNGFGQRVSITSVFYHLSNQGCSTQESALMQNCVSAHETITEESRTRCNWRGYCSIDFTYPETPDCDPNFSGTIVLFVHYECYPVAAGEVLHPTNVDSHQSHRGSRVYLLSESYPETFEPWLGSSRSYYSCNILISNSLMVKMTVNDLSYDDTTTEAPYCVMVEGFTTCAKKAHRPVTHFLNRDGQQGAAYHLSLLRNISGDFSARFWILLESARDEHTLEIGDVMAVKCGTAYEAPFTTLPPGAFNPVTGTRNAEVLSTRLDDGSYVQGPVTETDDHGDPGTTLYHTIPQTPRIVSSHDHERPAFTTPQRPTSDPETFRTALDPVVVDSDSTADPWAPPFFHTVFTPGEFQTDGPTPQNPAYVTERNAGGDDGPFSGHPPASELCFRVIIACLAFAMALVQF